MKRGRIYHTCVHTATQTHAHPRLTNVGSRRERGERKGRATDLGRYLAGDLVGADGMLDLLALEAEVSAEENQWDRNAEPEADEGAQRTEGDGAAAPLTPDDEVHDEED